MTSPESAHSKPSGASTHAIVLGEYLLSVCRAPGFSVAALTAGQSHDVPTSNCRERRQALSPTRAAVQYKAMEIHRRLSADPIGSALHDLVQVSAQQQQDQLNSYTLSSMLDSDDGSGESREHLMDVQTSSAARNVFATCLRHTYSGIIKEAMALFKEECSSKKVDSVCIFDHRQEDLCCECRSSVEGQTQRKRQRERMRAT